MRLQKLELAGFKSFAKKTTLLFDSPITAIVGPNGSGKSNVAEAFRWVLGEQSIKSLRGKRSEDLIWNGSEREGRSSRAVAAVTFDNHDRRFDLDFDEVVVSREVHRDGVSEYRLNGSPVRLRDVLELLAGVSLGPSGHHIVSQGDADRILSASLFERKAMIEDALGLKVFQWKLAESRKKLDQTEENKKQVESLRREIAPHLKFLKKQVEKIERADEYRRTLKDLYKTYLAREAGYLAGKQAELTRRRAAPLGELKELENRIAEVEQIIAASGGKRSRRDEGIVKKEAEIESLRQKKDDLGRTLGRLEGLLEAQAKLAPSDKTVPVGVVQELIGDLDDLLESGGRTDDLAMIKRSLSAIKTRLNNFINHELAGNRGGASEELGKLELEKTRLQNESERLSELLAASLEQYEMLKQSVSSEREDAFRAERELFELRGRRQELNSALELVKAEEARWQIESDDLDREIAEGAQLVDHEVKSFVKEPKLVDEPRAEQEARRKEIERLKLRLEDMGVESTDVLNEYKQAGERDDYLAKELADLTASAESLVKIMADLEAELETTFEEGVKKINAKFSDFFALMFGGGTAKLTKVLPEKKKKIKDSELLELAGEFIPPIDDEEEGEQKIGIEIEVALPRKKIKGLQMLSGGERALTSIALLFAIASVNPPPFLILDETDAALDEANSKKYGDMIETLSKSSQLILITHNRETMSRAGILYGVTMGADSTSRLLSVKFDQAQSFAK
jgi:chromosome segregation protein